MTASMQVKTFLHARRSASIVLLLITIVGFWPLSTGFFSAKNDDVIYFLPYRYNIVEIIRSGHFPLWSPYIYMGTPIAGDMQSGVWNPFVWLLSLTGRYTLSSLHAELLLYIYLGGIGMFKLMKVLSFGREVCYTVATCYMFSGFNLDSGQILCWVSCAAFLPFTYIYFIELLQAPTFVKSTRFALANFFLFVVAGYPFFFLANSYFLILAFLIFCIYSGKIYAISSLKTLSYLAISACLFLLMSAGPLLAFTNLMPFYGRGHQLSPDGALYNSYSLFSLISMVLPLSVTRYHAFFSDNIVISRNIYTGILILPFVIAAIKTGKSKWWNIVVFLTLLALLLSLGRLIPLRKWAYLYLPLMNSFRHPANFRLFVTIGLLALGGKGLQELMSKKYESNRKSIINIYGLVMTGTCITAFYFFPFHEHLPDLSSTLTLQGIKSIFNGISFRQAILAAFLLQVPFMIGGYLLLKKRNYRWYCCLSILNVIIIAQPQIFSGTVAKNPVFEINRFIRKQAPGFPIPIFSSPVYLTNAGKLFIYEYKEPVEYFFNKQIAINSYFNNPTILTRYNNFLEDSLLRNRIREYPLVYFADSIQVEKLDKDGIHFVPEQNWLKKNSTNAQDTANNLVTFASFQPNEFRLNVKAEDSAFLVILQNNFDGWQAKAGGTSIPILTVNKTFMGIKLPPGENTVHFEYRPDWFFPGMTISSLTIIFSLLLPAFKKSYT